MFRITPADALLLIAKERAIVRVLQSDPNDYSPIEFEFNQYADPENNRPVRPLEEKADRNYVYHHKTKTFVKRELKRQERGLPQPGNKRIKAVSGTLLPVDGVMRLYNHALINQGHRHVIYGVDSGENPDRYLYLHKEDPSIDVSQEDCLIVSCFTGDAGTNTKWHIKGQSLNAYHAGVYPEAVSFLQLREHNREFIKKRTDTSRNKNERNEVKFKASVNALRFVGAVSGDISDRLNALHCKMVLMEKLGLDLPILIFSDSRVSPYLEHTQVIDILQGVASGVLYAFDVHDQLHRLGAPSSVVAENYLKIFPKYQAYVQQVRVFNAEAEFYRFEIFDLNHFPHIGMDKNQEEKSSEKFTPQFISDAKAHALGRKAWSDIVSQTDSYNATQDSKAIEVRLVQRMKNKGVTGNTKKIYHDMIVFLQEQTRIVLGFQAKEVISDMPKGLHALNLAEMRSLGLKNEREAHLTARKTLENKTFHFIPDIEKQFTNTIVARPRYAFLTLANWHNEPALLSKNYGKSFVVLQPVMKFNSVFVPHNIVNEGRQANPCSYFHFEVLLEQATDRLFCGLVHAVSGQLPDKKIQENAGYEMHAYFPPISLFDSHAVERIYIDPNEHKLSDDEKQFIEKRGIHVCAQTETSAYAEEKKQLMTAADATQCAQLLKRYPFLKPSREEVLTNGLKDLYDVLLVIDPSCKPATWQTILTMVPLNALHRFIPTWSPQALVELTTTWDSEVMICLFTTTRGVISCDTWDLFIHWAKQFRESLPERSKGFACLLWEYAIGLQDEAKLIGLFKEGFYHNQDTQFPMASLLSNPKLQSVTHFIITEKYYKLTHTEFERECLALGENYWFISDMTYLEKLLTEENANASCFAMLSSFFKFAETRNQVDSLILALHYRYLLKHLTKEDIEKLVDVAVQNKKTEMAILTLVTLFPADRKVITAAFTRLIEGRASPELVFFLSGILSPHWNYWPEGKLARLPFYLLDGPYSLAPFVQRLVGRQALDLLIIWVLAQTFSPAQQDELLAVLRTYRDDQASITPEKKHLDIIHRTQAYFSLETFDVKQVALGLHAWSRLEDKRVMTDVCMMKEVQAYPDEMKQALIFELLEHYPTTFNNQALFETIVLGLPSLDFLQTPDRVVYGCFDYYAIYFQTFIKRLLAEPDKLPRFLEEGVLFYSLRPDLTQHQYAIKKLNQKPQLKNVIRAADNSSFLHCAMMRAAEFTGDCLRTLVDCKGANEKNAAGLTSLMIAIRHLSQCKEDEEKSFSFNPIMSRVDTIKWLLQRVNYTPDMILEALHEVITGYDLCFELFNEICNKLNTLDLSASKRALTQCFFAAFEKPHRDLWAIFLTSPVLTGDVYTQGLYLYINKISGKYVSSDINLLLDRCDKIVFSQAILGKLTSTNNITLLSKIIARDQCEIENSFGPVLWNLFLEELKDLEKPADALVDVMKNFICALKRWPTYAEKQKNSLYVDIALSTRSLIVGQVLVVEGFAVSHNSLSLILERYSNELLSRKSESHPVLVSMIKALPRTPISLWNELSEKKRRDVAVPDSGGKIREIRLLGQFAEDFCSQDETMRARIEEEVQTTIRVILRNREEFHIKMKAYLLQRHYSLVFSTIAQFDLSKEARTNLERFEKESKDTDIACGDPDRLQRLLSGKSDANQDIIDMITLYGKTDVLLQRENLFMKKVQHLVPTYFWSAAREMRLYSQNVMHIPQLIQLIQCYYLLDLYDHPNSPMSEVYQREKCINTIMEKIAPMKGTAPSVSVARIGFFTPNTAGQTAANEEKQASMIWEFGQ